MYMYIDVCVFGYAFMCVHTYIHTYTYLSYQSPIYINVLLGFYNGLEIKQLVEALMTIIFTFKF